MCVTNRQLLSLPNKVWRLIVFAPFLIITSPRMQSGDVLLFYVSFSLLLLLLLLLFFLLLFFHTFFSARFLGDAWIKLYETLQEYHMPCEVVLLRVDFFQNGCRCHGNGQLAKQKLMKLDRNNIHIQWNEISQKKWNRLDKLCRSCHRNKKGRIKKKLIPFIKLHEILQEYPPQCVAAFGGLKKFKMAAVAMVTKVQKMLNSLQTADPFET